MPKIDKLNAAICMQNLMGWSWRSATSGSLFPFFGVNSPRTISWFSFIEVATGKLLLAGGFTERFSKTFLHCFEKMIDWICQKTTFIFSFRLNSLFFDETCLTRWIEAPNRVYRRAETFAIFTKSFLIFALVTSRGKTSESLVVMIFFGTRSDFLSKVLIGHTFHDVNRWVSMSEQFFKTMTCFFFLAAATW